MCRFVIYADTDGKVEGKVIVSLEDKIPESIKKYLVVYTDIHLYQKDFWLFGSDTDVQQLKDTEVEFMRKVVKTYREGSDDDVLALWDSKGRQAVKHDMQYGRASRTASLRLLFAHKIKVMGKIYTPNGAVLYWRALFEKVGKQGPISTFFMSKSNKGYLLTGGLEDNYYYAGQILQNTVMARAIELWTKQTNEANMAQ